MIPSTLHPRPSIDDVRGLYAYLQIHAQGRANAIPARELSVALSLGPNGDRALRALAHAANEQGLLILADNAGYFIPATPAEAQECIGRLMSQATEMIERAYRLRALIDREFHSTQLAMPI